MDVLRAVGYLLVLVAILGASSLPDSWYRDGLYLLAGFYFWVTMFLRARSGWLRRRPFWTAHSWRRYLWVASVPVAAIVVAMCMAVAVDLRLPIVGVAQSTTRSIWAVGTIFFMIIGAGGIVTAIEWLHRGDAGRQFVLPGWVLFGRRREG